MRHIRLTLRRLPRQRSRHVPLTGEQSRNQARHKRYHECLRSHVGNNAVSSGCINLRLAVKNQEHESDAHGGIDRNADQRFYQNVLA